MTAAPQQRGSRSVEIDTTTKLTIRTPSASPHSLTKQPLNPAHGRIAAKLNPSSPRPNAPAGRQLGARRRLSTPSQIQKPAEDPSLRPSLALNIDLAPVHLLTHSALPQPPARAPIQSCSSHNHLQLTHITPSSHRHPHDSQPRLHLFQLQTHTCISSSPTNTLHFLQSGSPLPCISSSPANPSSVSSTGPGTNSVARPGQDPESVAKTDRSIQLTRMGL